MKYLMFFLFCSALTAAEPMWIWKSGKITTEKAEFRREIDLVKAPKQAQLMMTCDNGFTLILNGKEIAKSSVWQKPAKMDLSKKLKKGKNVFEVKADNEGNMGGLLIDLRIDGKEFVSNKNWQARALEAEWSAAVEIKKYGASPWGKVFGKIVVANAPAKSPATLPVTTLPGFKAEKIYTIDKKTEGSWVGMTYDNRNRLITCDQYGGIYRLDLKVKPLKAEKLKVKVDGAHGVLYAFNSLYVFRNEIVRPAKPKVAESKPGVAGTVTPSPVNKIIGLYRLSDTNGDDQYDKEECIVPYRAAGEHGVHSIVLSPDEKSLFLISGNQSDVPGTVKSTRMSRKWKEDHILPRMDDGRGHNRGRLAPGGFVLKISPDGKEQELISHGFRNQYDAAFNLEGELFTYDADMEYDIGSPWYRPTRVNHVVSGSDFGWRHGSGKWPEYYTDTLPTTLDIGPGSPTGVCIGIGAKFPAKYQKSLFINDWTYGTMYAVHLERDGATYKATREEFVSGKPLPLTDVFIHPDGNMFFMFGGRRTCSALYKVSYVGKESTAAVSAKPVTAEMALRRDLEKLHVDGTGAEAIETAWPHLKHEDRYVRYAARVAIEKQPVGQWQNKLKSEKNEWAIIEAATALARMGDKGQQSIILKKLNQLSYQSMDTDKFLGAIRAYQLAFTRLGKPDQQDADKVVSHLNPLFPSKNNFINRELAQVLLYLNAPGVISRTVQEMMTATEVQKKILSDKILQRNDRYAAAAKKAESFRPNTQQMSLAFSLRSIKVGWTEADRASYFSWFPRAKTWQGGNSLSPFIANTLKEALANVANKDARKKYATISSKNLKQPRAITPPKGPGQMWTVETAVKAVKDNLTDRNFKNGENLFHATACASCHRFAGQSEGIGPDLTGAANRYSLRDMMENIIKPSAVISDQYGSTVFTMKDGSEVIGRKGTEEDGLLHLMTNPYSAEYTAEIKTADVAEEKHWTVSPMPQGLVYSLNADELSDLIAYIFSAGKADHEYFQSSASKLEGGVQLFNGKDLTGWKGDSKLWKVEDGVIYGSTHGNKLKSNTFLIWEGEVADFHLMMEARFEGNNSGMMYRSFWADEKTFRLSGYQCDMHPKPEFTAMLYGEGLGRGIIAKRGQKVEIDANKKVKVTGKTTAPEPLDVTKWQTYEIICKGNSMIHKINGKVTVDITDNDPRRLSKGMIGLQLHAGPEMKVWARNIQIKKF